METIKTEGLNLQNSPQSDKSISSNGFLPADYQLPQEKSAEKLTIFFKPSHEKVSVRILSSPAIMGWESWENRRCIRTRTFEEQKVPVDVTEKPRHFWAMKVFNRATNSIQLWVERDSKALQTMMELIQDPRCGNPIHYDLIVSTEVIGKKTITQIKPAALQPLNKEAIEMSNTFLLSEEAVFKGSGNPFVKVDKQNIAPSKFNQPENDCPF